MNIALFFEGTGQGVWGNYTNVTRMCDLTVESPRQLRHLESGPGTHFGTYLFGSAMGVDIRAIHARARRWFEANYERYCHVFLFGFSRGALLARHFAAWLDKLDIEVTYLGLWDTVDSTVGFDVSRKCPGNVRRARHAVARDEHRKHFDYVPLQGAPEQVEELLFPGSHSDIGGLYADNHAIADETLRWIAEGARAGGLELVPNAKLSSPASTDFTIHNSLGLFSNLFGLLGRINRTFGKMLQHPLCSKCLQI